MNPDLDDLQDESNWLEYRAQALPPQLVTELVTTDQTRHEFILGARMLRLDRDGKFVFPHQLVVTDMLNAGHESNGFLLPRRSTKTTSVIATVMGRCEVRSDYQAAMTLTTKAHKTSQRFKDDISKPIELTYPDRKTRPVKVSFGKGDEYVSWPSGSKFAAASPNGDAFRSSAYDFVLVDESGEASPEQGVDLKGAILPTFDTRPGAQIVYTGTAGIYRQGLLLWDALQDPTGGRLIYAFPDDTSEETLLTWDTVRPLVEATHPGVYCGFVPIETVEKRFYTLGPVQFAREYGGIFGTTGGATTILDLGKWKEAGTDAELPEPPERFGLAFMVHRGQACASVVAAWRDDDGKAHLLVLAWAVGGYWVSEKVSTIANRYNVPVAWDTISGPSRVEVEKMERAPDRPLIVPQYTNNIKSAAALLVDELNRGRIVHYNQAPLDEAAKVAVKRDINGGAGWSFGAPKLDQMADITALEAAAMALRMYDENDFNTSSFVYVSA